MILKEFKGFIIAVFDGEINLNSVNQFKEELVRIGDQFDKDIALDLSSVNYINSLGLGAIIELYKKQKAKKRVLKIICNSPMVREVFDVVKFGKLMSIIEDEEEL